MITLFGNTYKFAFNCYAECHAISTIAIVAVAIIYLVFAEISTYNFFYAGVTVLLSTVFGLIFRIIEEIFDAVHKCLNWTKLRKCKSLMLFSMGCIFIFATIPKIMVLFIGYDFYIFWTMNYFCFLLISIIWTQYIEQLPMECLYRLSPNAIVKILHLLNVILTIALCRVGTSYPELKDKIAVIAVNLVFFPVTYVVLIDVMEVLRGQVRVKTPPQNAPNIGVVGNAQIAPAAVAPRVETNGEKSEQKIDCKICLLEYSDVHVPRILIHCGHTVCEGCADVLLNYTNKKYLICPFCQMVTVVKGAATLLPKNYALMDVVDNAKNK